MYRLLVRLYPAAHRRAFGEQMVQTFGDHYRDAVEVGGGSRLRFWVAVLADAGTSLRTEHAAELGALWRRGRRQAATRRLRRGRLTRCEGHRRVATLRRWAPGSRAVPGGMTRRRRVRLRLRYRPSAGRPVRVVFRSHHRQLVYRGRIAVLAGTVVLIAAALGAGTATGHLGTSVLVTGLLLAAWLGHGMRLDRRIPAGPRGDGSAPPGGAGVREPRRPLPLSPAGSAAWPMPDQDPPGQATALI
ncbi:hypothetical protein GCM10023322_83970 [Rugosimonospora acidiphila]|uniref:Uncharacterized protein n=1 Tax=Rugosimonospora acidiphila TaxID=556531 RepID=A0ABP9ST19_9ACTN